METTDTDETISVLQSAHREWIEDRERQEQLRDKLAVEKFLAQRLRQKGKACQAA